MTNLSALDIKNREEAKRPLAEQYPISTLDYAKEFDCSRKHAQEYFRDKIEQGDPDFIELSKRKLRMSRARLEQDKSKVTPKIRK